MDGWMYQGGGRVPLDTGAVWPVPCARFGGAPALIGHARQTSRGRHGPASRSARFVNRRADPLPVARCRLARLCVSIGGTCWR